MLPGLTLEEAANVAERIRARIDSKEILVKKSVTLRISASLGVSSAQETGNYNFEQLQSIADARLYEAKQGTQLRRLARSQQEVIEPFAPARGAGTLRVINPFRAIVLQRNALAVNAFNHHRKIDAV